MTFPKRARWQLTTAAVFTLLPLAFVACGDDESATPSCPDLPLFDIRELAKDAGSDAAQAAFEEWKAEGNEVEGCVTGPGTAVLPEGGGG